MKFLIGGMMEEVKDEVVVYDVEADGLLDTITRVWVIAATSLCGKKVWIFTNQDTGDYKKDGSLEDGVGFLLSRKKVICHNSSGYDTHVFEKFWPHLWNRNAMPFSKQWDTFVQSKCQHFDRPFLKGCKSNHSLEYYGVAFKYPKPAVEDWSYWDAKKLERCLIDIEINRKAYHFLQREAKTVGLDFTTQIRRTQAAQYWYTKQEEHGTFGNKELMEKYVKELDEKLEELRLEIEPNLPPQIKVKNAKCTWETAANKLEGLEVDQEKLSQTEKNTYVPTIRYKLKNGKYDKHTANHFDIDEDRGDSPLVDGPYTKIEFVKSKLSQHAIVKDYLLSQGWKPTQWNFEKSPEGGLAKDINGKPIKKSPKLTEDSFDSIKGDIGNKIALYNTLTHRRRTFKNEKDDTKGWINQLRPDGRIASGALAWQTSTGRCAQFGIVNVASGAATFGKPMREVWQAPEGKILVSVDMDSAQMRLLANFMGDDEYTKAVIEGEEFDAEHNYVGSDAHSLNAMAFGTLPEELWKRARETQDPDLIDKASSIRKTGKNGFYALLFGAGDLKLAQTLKVKGGAKEGAKIKESFRKKLAKAGELQDKLEREWRQNRLRGGGYIEVAGNTWVWCPGKHKLLNFLLMGSEAVLQNQAVCWINNEIPKRNLNGKQIISIHDEQTFEFPLQEKESGIKLLSEMYGTASKGIGLDVIVTGTAQAGKNWLEIH